MNTTSWKGLAASLALVASGLLASELARAAVDLNLKQAIDSAMQKNPAILAAREKLRESETLIPLTRSALFPSISAGLSAAYRKDPLNIGNPAFGGEPYNFYDFNVRAVQGFYAGGAVSGAIEAAKKENRIRELELSITERDVMMKTIQAFFGLLLQQKRVQTLERSLEFQKWLHATARERYRVGSSRVLEVLQTKTQLALVEPQLAKARNEVQTRAVELAQLIGEPAATSLRVTGSLEPLRWKDVQAAAIAAHDQATELSIPELQRVRAAQDQVNGKRSVTLAKHYPKLDGFATWGKSSYVHSDLFDELATYWNVGLQLTIPIFSGLSSVHERRQIAAVAAQLEVEETRVRDQFSLDQIRARKDVELAEPLFIAHKTALEAAVAAQKEARTSRRLGTSTYQQVFDTEKSLTEAEFAFEQARYDYILAQARFFIASGWKLNALVQLLTRR